jgi:hypothetical protein
MATDVTTPSSDTSVTRLVSGIIDDAQTLFQQQAQLLKADIRKDIREASDAGMSLGAGGVLLALAGFMLLFTLVHLLKEVVAPSLPYWACYGIVTAVVALIGGVLFYRGQQQFEALNPLPENSVEAIQETLQWQTSPTPTTTIRK